MLLKSSHYILGILILNFLLLFSCGFEQGNSSLPPALGEVNGMVIVTDTTLWNHGIKKRIVPILQHHNKEYDTFDISAITPQAVNDIFRKSYNMLFIVVLDNDSPMGSLMEKFVDTKIINEVKNNRKDWLIPIKNLHAIGQRVVYIVVNDEKELSQRLDKEGDRLLHYFDSHLQENVINQLKKLGLATSLIKKMNKKGYNMDLPKTFSLALDTLNFQWYRKILGPQYDENIIVYRTPYVDENVFTEKGLLEFRENMTKKFLVDPTNKSLYITTQDIYPMKVSRVYGKQEYVVEAEGLWKASNNTRGGPYKANAFLDPKKNEFYYVEYWLYSPKYSKDKPIRTLEAILESFRFVD